MAQEHSFRADTFEPDNTAPIDISPGAGNQITYLTPCREFLRRTKLNAYNLNFVALPTLPEPPPEPPPEPDDWRGILEIALFRCTAHPTPDIPLISLQYIPGSLSTNSISMGSPTVTSCSMDRTIDILGGSYWIAIRFEDQSLNGAVFTALVDGFTASDANITGEFYESTYWSSSLIQTTGNFSLTGPAQLAVTSNELFVRADYV